MLTTLVTPSLVFCKVSIVYTSILIPLTSLPQTELQVTSTMSLVIRVLPLMTLVCSIAHMFPSRWFVPLERTPSSPRLAFKTRYGLVANPFAEGTNAALGALRVNSNRYYRRVAVKNLM